MPLTPEVLVYDTLNAADPQVSPDGTHLCFTVGRADREADRGTSQIWSANIDGSDAVQLTSIGKANREARWAPDGQSIAFVSDRVEGKSVICVLPIGRPGEAREVATHAQTIGNLAWSPDGQSIAYTTTFDPENPDELPHKGAPRVRVTRRLDYKQDNRGYVNNVRTQVFVVDTASGSRRRVTSDPDDHWYPQWSPDGRRLAARVSYDNGIRSKLAVIDVDSVAVTYAGVDSGSIGVWAWSADGRSILYSGDADYSPQHDLYLYDVASKRIERLTTDLPCHPEAGFPTILGPSQPVWLDDQTVLFHAVESGDAGLYRFHIPTRALTRERATQSMSIGFSTDRAHRFVAQAHSTLESMGEIVVYQRETKQPRVVTNLNAALFQSSPPAAWEKFEVERDGLTIDAWLLKPPGFDPQKKYPVVLDVHGGPHGYYGYGFNAIQQVLAAQGFLVVFSNPRGSGSYGRDFADRVRFDWGGEDYLDLMSVLDAALERPFADAERTGIWGYSYGGFMTAWTIGHTQRFKAAVCGAPCFDLESMYGTSDISHAWGPHQWGGTPHEASEAFAAHSPSTFAHRATTPTLIMQGEADDRCPIGQGEQMFVALQQAGCEVEFARYPGGSHAMLRVGPPSHRADFMTRLVGWFSNHLGSAH